MKLIWNGHACFTLECAAGTIVLDPYLDDVVPGLSHLRLTADTIYCSHEHRDHGGRKNVTLTGREIAVPVEEIHTYHDDTQGSQRGENIIRIFTLDGMRVAHMGDLGCDLTPEQCAQLENLDAMIIPVGGFYTIDAKAANTLAEKLKPRVVIPIHYKTDTYGYEVLSYLKDFTDLRSDVVEHPGNTLELEKDTPAQTAVLIYQG